MLEIPLTPGLEVHAPGHGGRRSKTSEEVAVVLALAPVCEYCNVKVIGHGTEEGGSFYCCAHCARMAGAEGVSDRA